MAHPILENFAPTDFLQTVTLLSTRHRRLEHLTSSPADGRVPAITCTRKDILRLSLTDYQKWAPVAALAIEQVVPFLHEEHIFKARDVPYATQLVPIAAIFAALGEKAEGHGARQKLRQWYWCGVFGEMYGGSTETRFGLDLQDVVAWVADDGPEPRTVKDAQFQVARHRPHRAGQDDFEALFNRRFERNTTACSSRLAAASTPRHATCSTSTPA